jgi:hypothetical protein
LTPPVVPDDKPVDLQNQSNSDVTIPQLRSLAREITGACDDICRVFYQVNKDSDNVGSKAITMRAVDTVDVMTANVVDISDIISDTANQILDEVPNVKRVFYDITDKPPGTIEFE